MLKVMANNGLPNTDFGPISVCLGRVVTDSIAAPPYALAANSGGLLLLPISIISTEPLLGPSVDEQQLLINYTKNCDA